MLERLRNRAKSVRGGCLMGSAGSLGAAFD
jgi:hypothetical protein